MFLFSSVLSEMAGRAAYSVCVGWVIGGQRAIHVPSPIPACGFAVAMIFRRKPYQVRPSPSLCRVTTIRAVFAPGSGGGRTVVVLVVVVDGGGSTGGTSVRGFVTDCGGAWETFSSTHPH